MAGLRQTLQRLPGRAVAALALILAAPCLATAQQAATSPVLQSSPVLTLDQDRLFIGTAYGMRVAREIEEARKALAIENREIEAVLATEERDLTIRRATMTAAEFRPLADVFDAKVVETRRVQDEKLARLNGRRDLERQTFYQAASPVLADLVREAGAVAILDARAVFLSADRIDVTDEAIIRIDLLLGEGPIKAPAPAVPDPAP